MTDILDQKSTAPQYVENRQLPNATATLVLGILSIVICLPGFILGIIGIVLHKKDKELYMTNPQMYEQSYKNAKAGYICSIVGTCLSVFIVIFYILYFIFIFSMISHFPRH